MKTLPNGCEAWAGIRPLGTNDDQTPQLDLEVRVADDGLAKKMPGFDKMEKAFALVPARSGDEIIWKRYDLEWQEKPSQKQFYYENGRPLRQDVHQLVIHASVEDLRLVQKLGVAFGIETNRGTVWAQTPDDNFAKGVEVDQMPDPDFDVTKVTHDSLKWHSGVTLHNAALNKNAPIQNGSTISYKKSEAPGGVSFDFEIWAPGITDKKLNQPQTTEALDALGLYVECPTIDKAEWPKLLSAHPASPGSHNFKVSVNPHTIDWPAGPNPIKIMAGDKVVSEFTLEWNPGA